MAEKRIDWGNAPQWVNFFALPNIDAPQSKYAICRPDAPKARRALASASDVTRASVIPLPLSRSSIAAIPGKSGASHDAFILRMSRAMKGIFQAGTPNHWTISR